MDDGYTRNKMDRLNKTNETGADRLQKMKSIVNLLRHNQLFVIIVKEKSCSNAQISIVAHV